MKRIPAALLAGLIASGGGAATPEAPPDPPPVRASDGVTQTPLEAARAAVFARDYKKARELAGRILEREDFESWGADDQFEALWIAAVSAMWLDDPLEAHDYLVVLTEYEEAGAEVWKYRAQTASQIDDWEDSLVAMTQVAKYWPDQLRVDDYDQLVNYAARMSQRKPDLRQLRFGLLNALFDGGFKQKYGLQPDELWIELVAEALERGDMARARTVAKRITGTSALVQLCADRRFDALLAAEPSLRNVRANAVRMKQRLAEQVKLNPRSLEALMIYSESLAMLGEFAQMLKITTAAIEKVEKAPADSPPYDDVATYLAWAQNQKSRALSGLGQIEEAIRVLADWRQDPRNTADRASQAINLAAMLNGTGKPAEALQAVESIDWVKGVSPYGRMQLQAVRHEAYAQLGQSDEAATVLAWIREHQQESPWTAQASFLVAGDVESAAAILASALENPDTRAAALQRLQIFERRRGKQERTEFRERTDENWGKVLEHPDVKAAMEKYGHSGTFDVYPGHL